jgi:hypothetical protein
MKKGLRKSKYKIPRTYCQMRFSEARCCFWEKHKYYGVFLMRTHRLIAKFDKRKEALDFKDWMNKPQAQGEK